MMKNSLPTHKCKSCGFSGTGNYCSQCGQSFNTKRITIRELLRELIHFFTHIEKGFFYTLKQLIVAPGRMQLAYIEGKRNIHQKPFSMFLICATFTALFRYWIFFAVTKYYQTDIISEAKFFHEYLVITYISLIPIYILITYLLFYRSGYNYAEIGVMMLYTISICFLMAGFIALVKLIFPHLDTAYVEFPVIILYFTVTLINFFKAITLWKVIIKSLITMSLIFLIEQVVESFLVRFFS
jgi:hypothetical protein